MQYADIDLTIHAGKIISLDDQHTIIDNGTVLIRKDQIVYAGERLAPNQFSSGRVIQVPNSAVLPPFFNQHTHPSLSLYRGLGADLPLNEWLETVIWPLEKKFSSPETVFLGAMLSCLEMIRGGTGSVATMDYHTREVGRAMESAGMRSFLGEAVFNSPTPSCSSPWEAFEYTSDMAREVVSSELTNVYMAIHAPYTSTPELYKKAAEISLALGIMTTSHIAETKKERDWCMQKFGKTPVQFIQSTGILDTHFILIHGIHLDDEDLEILARHHIPVIHNPHSNMVLGSGVCRIPDLLSAGIRVGLGTDSAASNNGLSMLKEMQTMSRLQKVFWKDASIIPAQQALHMAIRSGHDIYRTKAMGQIKAGFKADLQIIDLNKPHAFPDYDTISTLVYSSSTGDISHLIVNGQVLMEDSSVLSLDEEIVMKEVRKMKKKIKQFKSSSS